MTATSAKPKGTAKAPNTAAVDMDPSELMKGQGGNGWFNPNSNDQISWQLADASEESIPRALYRIHAWMKWYTTTRGNRQPYANREGTELHLEHMARDLGIEINNLRTYWRQGIAMGLWRGGTQTEGTKRLYLCAKIARAANVAEVESQKRVCTNPLPTIFQSLRPYIREQLEKLTPEQLQDAAARYARIEEVRKVAHADVLAAVRIVTDQDEDNLWIEIGVEKKRLRSTKEVSPEEAAQLAERQGRIDSILPHVHGYVHTLFATVQTQNASPYIVEKSDVQRDSAGPSLLGLETLREEKSGRAVPPSSGAAVAHGRVPSQDGEKSVYLPVAESRVASKEEREAAGSVINGIAGLQRKYPKRFSGERVDIGNKGDMASALKIVREVGIPSVADYLSYAEHRAVQGALGHRVGMGMLVEWTGDFRRAAAEQERVAAANAAKAAQDAAKRAEIEQIAEQQRERETAIAARVTAAWNGMTDGQKSQRIIAAEAECKAAKQYNWRTLPNETRRELAEKIARSTLRREMENAAMATGAAQ